MGRLLIVHDPDPLVPGIAFFPGLLVRHGQLSQRIVLPLLGQHAGNQLVPLFFTQAGLQLRLQDIRHPVQFSGRSMLCPVQNRADDPPLPAGPADIGIELANAAEHQGVFAVHVHPAVMKLNFPVRPGPFLPRAVEVLRLLFRNVHIDSAERVNDLGKRVVVHEEVRTDLDLVVVLQRLYRAGGPAVPVRGVELAVRPAGAPGQIRVAVPVKRHQMGLPAPLVDRQQNHGIGKLTVTVHPEKQDVSHVPAFHGLSAVLGPLFQEVPETGRVRDTGNGRHVNVIRQHPVSRVGIPGRFHPAELVKCSSGRPGQQKRQYQKNDGPPEPLLSRGLPGPLNVLRCHFPVLPPLVLLYAFCFRSRKYRFARAAHSCPLGIPAVIRVPSHSTMTHTWLEQVLSTSRSSSCEFWTVPDRISGR